MKIKTKTTENYFSPTRMAKIKRQTVTRIGNDVEKLELTIHCFRNVK